MTPTPIQTHGSPDSTRRVVTRRRRGWIAFGGAALLLLGGIVPAAASMSAKASVRQPMMTLGQQNVYTITIQNAPGAPELNPPRAAGLVFGNRSSRNNERRIVNGVASTRTSMSWTFNAEETGEFVIPGRQLEIEGDRIQVDDVTVTVVEMPEELRNRFFLRWKTPEDPFYVGQTLPATLQLYVRADINAGLGSRPSGSDDQFIYTEFEDEPRQRQETVEGRTYTVVEWDTAITPIKPGSGTLPVSLDVVYETGQRERGPFGPRPVQDQIRLRTSAAGWRIRELPRENRPESFSGAVGDFDVQTRLSKRELEVGEALTLTLEVRGQGNFTRIRAPEIEETDGWRVYPPKSSMEEDGVPYRGTKTFEYILSPTRENVKEAPAVAFSWFDPEKAEWREINDVPEPVQVRPDSRSPAGSLTATAEDSRSHENPAPDFHSIASTPGRSQSLVLPWKQPAFWLVNGGLGVVMAFALTGFVRQRRAARNPYLQLRSQAARKARTVAAEAIQANDRGDSLAFYTGAREALRHFLAATLDNETHNYESLTWNELEAILPPLGFDEESLARMRHLFARKDVIQFAGWNPSQDDLRKDRETFETILNQIVTRKS